MPITDPDAKREYQRNWMRARREKGFKYLGGRCIVCGSVEKLELDHIDRTQKVSHRIWSWTWEKQKVELDKCQLLCEVHHEIKTNEDFGFPYPEAHGTVLQYNKRGCRCDLCKEAVKLHWRERRKKHS